MKENGFSGLDFEIQDHDNEYCSEFSILVSTASTPEPNAEAALQQANQLRLVIVIDADSQLQKDVAGEIASLWSSSESSNVEITHLPNISEIENPKSAFILFLPELERSLLYDLPQSDFGLLQQFIGIAQSILWITHAPGDNFESTKLSMVDGLARTMRSEDNNRTFITLRFEGVERDLTTWGKSIIQVLRETTSHSSHTMELEYIQRDGPLLISRAMEAEYLDEEIHSKSSARMKEVTLEDAGPIALAVGTPGLLDTLHFVVDQEYWTPLPDDHIEVQVKYIGLNFRDVLVALGRFNDDKIGVEAAGIVTRVGSKCKTHKVGDRVCFGKLGAMKTHVRCHEDVAFNVPDDMPLEEATSLVVVGATAYQAFVKSANLQRGESVLIHSASGATGQMAVQIAQHFGCEVFVTVGSPEKRQLLKELYHISDDHMFYSRNRSFTAGIRRMTNGRGVDVVLNSLSGEALIASWELIAPHGRFVEIGKADISGNSKLPMSSFANNVSFSGLAIDHFLVDRPAVFSELLRKTLEMFENKSIRAPKPLHIFPISKVEEGMRFMQSGNNSGKIVFSMEPQDNVSVSSH